MQLLLREALFVYSRLRDEINYAIAESKDDQPRYSRFAYRQMHYYTERCQSLNILLQESRLWDCAILMRSAAECATRFIFVSVADLEERMKRIDEYEIALNEIDELQRSEKAKPALSSETDSNGAMLIGGVILETEREVELREQWPKVKRAQLKQKWSFSEIVKELSEFHNAEIDLRHYKSLLHHYGLSSHLLHADQTAVNLFWDRHEREPHVREMLEQAHFAGLLTNQVFMLFLCWRALVFATRIDSINRLSIQASITSLTKNADVFQRAFAESQAHLYPDVPAKSKTTS